MPATRRDIHLSNEYSARDARRRIAYTHPHMRIVKVRRVDPMTPTRGYIVTVEAR